MGAPISRGQPRPRPIEEITPPPAKRVKKEIKPEGRLGMGRSVQKCQMGGKTSAPRGSRRAGRIANRSRRRRRSARRRSTPSLTKLNQRCSVLEMSKRELFSSLTAINRKTEQLKDTRTRLINDMKTGVNLEKQLGDNARQLRLLEGQGRIHVAALQRLYRMNRAQAA